MQISSTYRSTERMLPFWAAAVAVGCIATGAGATNSSSLVRSSTSEMPHGRSMGVATQRRIDMTGREFVVYADGIGTNGNAFARETSEQEHAIAKLRAWEQLSANWDGDDAQKPVISSLRAASHFVCSLDRECPMPAPLLNENGRAGLFWQTDDTYADIEFSGAGTVAYYIERRGNRHKGIVRYDGQSLPDDLMALLRV